MRSKLRELLRMACEFGGELFLVASNAVLADAVIAATSWFTARVSQIVLDSFKFNFLPDTYFINLP
jgi:hypothetical protein